MSVTDAGKRAARLEPDRAQIELFVDALFRHASPKGFVSLRAFFEEDATRPFRISPTALTGGLAYLVEVAIDDARRAAQDAKRVVFCPPIATFADKTRAKERDVLEGLALSVECDERPNEARARLEALIGLATVIVCSGGVWIDPSGVAHDKIHMHWRLATPARGADLPKLKGLRAFAARIVGGDPSNVPACHPIRWPGSWHRKGEPRLCAIEMLDAGREIDLATAFDILAKAAPASGRRNGAGEPAADGFGAEPPTSKMPLNVAVDNILDGNRLHASITSAATGLVGGGLVDGLAVRLLRAIMVKSAAPHDIARWQVRYDYIPRAVSTARALIDADPQREARRGNGQWESLPNDAPPIGDPTAAKQIKTTMGTNMEPQSIAWLWPGWLAHGKLHILAGRPGCLKTTTAMDFAAAVTIGGQWPDGSSAAIGNVLVWSGEDAIDDTLLPRFMAAGGERARVAFISGVEEDGKSRAFDPARDLDALVAVCSRIGEINLIIIDPVVAVAKGDSHKNAEARRDLQPLVDLAERTQAVVLGIHHLTKRTEGADPVDRVSGSLAFGAGPRVVLLNAMDGKATSEPRGLLMRAKNNIGPAHGGFEFTADTRPLDGYPQISAQRILWGASVTESARDILERIEGKEAKAEIGKRKVTAFLFGALHGRGPRLAAEVIAEGEAAGCSEWALRRALKKLGGWSEKPGLKTGWIWELPEEAEAS